MYLNKSSIFSVQHGEEVVKRGQSFQAGGVISTGHL